MAMAIVLLATLSASHTASCLVQPHDVVGCQPSGYLPGSKGREGGLPSKCDGAYHDDSEMVVALSTGWFSGMSHYGRSIKITAKGGSSVYAKVVDECDSVHGCDAEHNYEEPCAYNVVDASPAVWDALGLDQNIGLQDVTWSDE
uniref:Ripening-related protein 2 n=1 Tax=Aegilops tauschii TaxID=37682 RepID=M8BZZ3_AEGTA